MAVLSLAALVLFGHHAPAQAAKVLKFGYILSADSQLGGGAEVFATEIAKSTEGRYTVEQYPDAMLGDEVAMMRDVQLGAIDFTFVTGAPLAKIVPEAGVFNIPFLFRNVDDARGLLDSPVGDDYLRKFEKAGVVALAWGENGTRQITSSKHPVRTPDDLKGMKIRLPQSEIMAAGFRALGAEVEQMPFTEVYTALQLGDVDAEENPVATILSARFSQVQTYLTLTEHVYDPAIILMSAEAYAELSPADKVAFRRAARLAGAASREIASKAEKTGIAALRADGMTVIDPIDTEAFAAKTAVAEPFFEKQFGRDVLKTIRAYRATSAGSSGITAPSTSSGKP